MYSPKALPALPRATCPAVVVTEVYHKGQTHLRGIPCNAQATSKGWCKWHKHIQTLLDLLDAIGYPELAVNKHLTIPSGLETWEEYLIRVPAPPAKEDEDARYCQILAAAKKYASRHKIPIEATSEEIMKLFEEVEPEYSGTNRKLARM